MILRRAQLLLHSKNIPKYYFGGGDLRHKFQDEVTDADYDKHQGEVFVKPVQEEKLFQFTSLASSLPIFRSKSFLSFIQNNFESNQAQSASDYFVPPRISENSVFVYHSNTLANRYRQIRALEGIVVPLAALTLTYPLFALSFLIPSYYFALNAQVYEPSRRIVVRMDILPHLEMVSVQRIGAFGILYTKLHRIQDLEHVPFSSVQENENYLWAIGGHGFDKNLIFRDRTTNEFLYFERNGLWDAKALEHPLIF